MRPIPMNAKMALSTLDGRKTQTRRPVKLDVAGRVCLGKRSWHLDDPGCIKAYPLGQIGDKLWVREPARVLAVHDFAEDGMDLLIRYIADRTDRIIEVPGRLSEAWKIKYAGKWPVPSWVSGWKGIPNGVFREAARIILEITNVRMERVQDISEYDAKAEGVPPAWLDVNGINVNAHAAPTFRQGFARTWNEIYASRGFGWDSDPKVWVVEFRRIEA